MVRYFAVSLVVLFLLAFQAGGASAQSGGPETLVDGFVNAWNTHDTSAFDRLFTDDAVWVAVAESRVEGRVPIVKDFAEIHATWAKATRIVASATEVHAIRPDVAVVLVHFEYLDGDGRKVPGVDRALMLVAVKANDHWRIAAGQITKQSPPAG